MSIRKLAQKVISARDIIADLAAARPPSQTRLLDARDRLDTAVESIHALAEEMFLLQEQNQQLRRDLAERVCARICRKGYRGAS
ncbi:MAG TPA: hypothetical protein VFF05_05110 [Rudaea sp.]|nr:hypothetical protein [Rudaea sp.]